MLQRLIARPLLVVLCVAQVLLMAALFPGYYYALLNNQVTKASASEDYERVYQLSKRMASWYGCEPDADGAVVDAWNSLWRRNPTNRHRSYLQAAGALVKLKRYEEAEQYLSKFDPKQIRYTSENSLRASVESLRGVMLMDQGQRDKALKHFEQALRRNPDDPQANYQIGRDLFERGAFLEAGLYLRRSVRLAGKTDEVKKLLNDIEGNITSPILTGSKG